MRSKPKTSNHRTDPFFDPFFGLRRRQRLRRRRPVRFGRVPAYTNPEDSNDFFQVRIEPASVWIPDSSAGRQYVVERATDQADDAEWTPLGPATTGNETNLDFTIGGGAPPPKAFYRGRAQIP